MTNIDANLISLWRRKRCSFWTKFENNSNKRVFTAYEKRFHVIGVIESSTENNSTIVIIPKLHPLSRDVYKLEQY